MFIVEEDVKLKNLLAKHSKIVEFKEKEKVYNYGDKADKIYFILSGLIRIFIKEEGKEIEIKRSKNGDFVGETAFTAKKYNSKAEVYLTTKALEFEISNLRKIMKKNNNFANKMINQLSDYIDKLQNKEKINLVPISEIDKKIEAEKKIKKQIAGKKNKYINQAANKIKDNKDFYLEGHSTYNQKASKNDDYYLYEKEIECPVCSSEMKIKKIRNSRLRIEKVREDLRPIYKNFKLYYYNILSCSNCLFTARRKDFNDFSKSKKKKVKNDFKEKITNEINKDFKIEYSYPRKINNVLDAHYLALKLYDFTNFKFNKRAFLWRELSWIYEDLKQKKLAEKASLKALKSLEKYYFKDNSNTSKKENDNLSLLLAVLYHKHEQENKALPLLDDLIRDKKVNIRQKNKARDLFLKIRENNNK